MAEQNRINLEEHAVGEIRITNGLASMCLGYRSYGGGSGTLWATPTEQIEFSVRGRRNGYYRGICQAIHPKRKSISILIVEGNTWGELKIGHTVEIHADAIGRYHRTNRLSDVNLVELARKSEETTYQNAAFEGITRNEVDDAFKKDFEELSKHFLGEKAYGKSLDFFHAYKHFADGGFKYEVQHGLTRRKTPRRVS